MEIKGGKNQVGTSNTQFIESIVTNSNNNFTININVNCTECCEHQHLDGISVSQGNIHHVIECLQKIATSGDQLAQTKAEAAIKCKIEPATQGQQQVVKKKKGKITGLSQQTSSPETTKAVIDSVKILDSFEGVLKPGDGVMGQGVYIGDGYVVRIDEDSKTVLKDRLNMICVFAKAYPYSNGDLNWFSREQRVQRALEKVGRACPVPGGDGLDFLYWTFIGLSRKQSIKRGFEIGPISFLRFRMVRCYNQCDKHSSRQDDPGLS